MYQAPDFIKVVLEQKNVFGSSCNPGTQLDIVDYGGDDLSKCQSEIILGETDKYQCWFVSNPPE